ncbi:nuclear transport factor 2 family protein [Sphingomonas sp. PAMC26645]|uniref:nuclear transport factor 2 family protein n=1 Tax=Sphingomonas sp. PAMC26645 TaxID=2565555 RepID=UPI001FF9C933|nr:nuclear transport factor 2 family protein [Sphingomonas sp. PAMC26645]
MGTEKNVQTVKDFFAAIGRGDKKGLLALVAEEIEWIIPGKDWPLAGTYRGHAGLVDLLETAARRLRLRCRPAETTEIRGPRCGRTRRPIGSSRAPTGEGL